VLALLGTAAYTQVGSSTSYVVLAAALFSIGLGLGATIVPSMAVAYRAVPRESVAQATSTINVVQRIAGSVGTAVLAIALQRALESRLGGPDGGIGRLAALSDGARDGLAPALADGFGVAFWVAFGLAAVALVPALLLPRASR